MERLGAGGIGGGELGFELVAPAHQLRHSRHDPLLLGPAYAFFPAGLRRGLGVAVTASAAVFGSAVGSGVVGTADLGS